MGPGKRPAPPPRHRPLPGGAPGGDSWEHVAAWYDALAEERGTEFHQRVIIPGLLRLLALKPGERALDMACGQGAVSRALRRAGASVTGVDLSAKLIELAKQRSSRDIRYLVGDARKLDGLEDARFDAVVCVLAAQNIDPIEPLFAEGARLLRPGGRLALVVNHPAFRIPRQSGWRWDERRKLVFREVDAYLTPLRIPIDMRPFRGKGRSVT